MKRAFLMIGYIGIGFYCLFALKAFYAYIALGALPSGSDLTSFVTGAQIVKAGKTPLLYNTDIQLAFQRLVVNNSARTFLLPFRGLPILALVYLPFTFVSLLHAYVLNLILSLVALGWATKLLKKAFPQSKPLALWVFWPTLASLTLGQYTPILLLIFLGVFLSFRGKSYAKAGAFIALFLFKPHFLAITPFLFLIAPKKLEFIKGFAGAMAILLAANTVLAGSVRSYFDYLAFVTQTEIPQFGSRPWHMFSLSAVTNVSLPINVILYLAALAVFYKRSKKSLEANFSIALISTLIFSPHTLVHDLITLIIPISWLNSKKPILAVSLFVAPLSILIGAPWIGFLILIAVGVKLLLF